MYYIFYYNIIINININWLLSKLTVKFNRTISTNKSRTKIQTILLKHTILILWSFSAVDKD